MGSTDIESAEMCNGAENTMQLSEATSFTYKCKWWVGATALLQPTREACCAGPNALPPPDYTEACASSLHGKQARAVMESRLLPE